MPNEFILPMKTVRDLLDYLNTLAPFSLQEEYDNSGLQVGNPESEITGILLCLDVTPLIISEAISKGCNVVLTHHPLLFKPLRSINLITSKGMIIHTALINNISIIAFHTNFDNEISGLNQFLSKALGLNNIHTLKPLHNKLFKLVTFCPTSHADKVRSALFDAGAGHIGNYDSCSFNVQGFGTFRALQGANPFVGAFNELHREPEERIEVVFSIHQMDALLSAMKLSHPYEEVAYDVYPLLNFLPTAGAGIVGDFPQPLKVDVFINRLKDILGIEYVKVSKGKNIDRIGRVAICGGAGGFLINDALKADADALVTADLKYHDFMDYGTQILLVDAGHYETEIHGFHQLRSLLVEKFTNFAVHFSEMGNNPVKYI